MYDVTPFASSKSVDCGACSMKMLLSYYGIDVDIDTLIKECNTTIIGCTGKDLLDCGKSHGLDMKAYSIDADELFAQDRPCIIWWKKQHWSVFAGLNDEGKPVICNSTRGRYPISRGIFKSMYSGIALFNGEPLSTQNTETLAERVTDIEQERHMTISREDFDLLDVTDSNVTYDIIEEDGSITVKKGED